MQQLPDPSIPLHHPRTRTRAILRFTEPEISDADPSISPLSRPLPFTPCSSVRIRKKTCIATADIVASTTNGRGESESLRSSETKKGGGGETEREGGKVT